jgi:pimeloyl-ACP methyl ester carboxylesterase
VIRWLRRVGIAVGALLVVALLAGTIFEFGSRAAAVRAYPAPGGLVDIGGRRIQLDCRGVGSPVVVLQSGLDILGALSWAAVHDQIGQFTRACAYSRAGVMWSDPDGQPFNAERAAEDLHEALARAGEKPPFVLVAHSLGGPYSMVFTRLYPSEVAGLVFVDASHPDQIERRRVAVGKNTRDSVGTLKVGDAVTWTGIDRLLICNDLSTDAVFDGFICGARSSARGQRPEQRSSTVDHSDIRGSRPEPRHHNRDSSGAASD